jgi:hypothetical protein
MTALFKFVVLLGIFLLQPMSNPTNKPSREPICKPINDQTTNQTKKQLEQDALPPGNLSSKGVIFIDQEQDNEIQSNSTDSSNTQPSNWQGPKQRSLVISARVPFATFHSNLSSGLVYCWVHSHTGFKSVTSTKKVSCSAFALMASEPVTFMTKVPCNTFASLVCVSIALTNKIEADSDFSDFKRQIFINNEADSNVSQFLSSILQLNETSSAFRMVANKHKCIIKNKTPSIFQLIVGFKQKHQSKFHDLVNTWLLHAFPIAKLGTTTDFQRIEMSYSNNDFQLVVNSKLILNCEGACTFPDGSFYCCITFRGKEQSRFGLS